MKTVGCMANRQIARELRVAPSTIDRQLARLGRHCLLYHTQQMQAAKPASAVVIDGFVSFEHSQFWPFHHHPAIEPGSDLIVYSTDEVRRSGTDGRGPSASASASSSSTGDLIPRRC
ncbi:MAG: helix-turn-helix domain-containing protein [bacterium]|nr:helix-turn-helix domain-containing protein [bacterium]